MLHLTITEELLGFPVTPGVSLEECVIRDAVRIVTFRHDKKIPMIIILDNFLMIPGGGVEVGESFEQAARREFNEEVGFEISDLVYLGEIIEQRLRNKQINHTRVYIGDIGKDLGGLSLQQDEKEDGHEVVWLSIDEAIERLSININSVDNVQGKAISLREKTILEYIKKLYTK